jgi:hypothetical protein
MNTNQKLKSFAASAGVIGSLAVGAIAEADVVAPPGLNPGDKFNLVFLSSSQTDATSSDPTGYDALVTLDAVAAGLNNYAGNPVTWKTLGSFGTFLPIGPFDPPVGQTSALERFNPASAIYTLNGDKVADNGTDLYDGSIANPVNVRPDLSVADSFVWTGSAASGGGEFAKEIGGIDGSTEVGNSSLTDSSWLQSQLLPNDGQFPVYAFSNELTVPGTVSVPESPSWIAGIGLLAASAVVRLRAKFLPKG